MRDCPRQYTRLPTCAVAIRRCCCALALLATALCTVAATAQHQLTLAPMSDIEAGDEFHARLRLSTSEVTGVDLVNPTVELTFPLSGTADDFEMFETSLAIADGIQSFDLTFSTGGSTEALGLLYVDDISVALRTMGPLLAGDFNNDLSVDAADYVAWRKSDGTQVGYETWRNHFGKTAGSKVLASAALPEPASGWLLMLGTAVASWIGQRRRQLSPCGAAKTWRARVPAWHAKRR